MPAGSERARCPDTSDKSYLRQAIGKAVEARRYGEDPFGAIVVTRVAGATDAAAVCARAMDSCILEGNPTAHAEMVAVSEACAHLGRLSLEGCTVYCSAEPCVMCAAALRWARVERVVYSVAQGHIHAASGGGSKVTAAEVLCQGRHPVELVGPLLPAEGWEAVRGHVFEAKARRWRAPGLLRQHSVVLEGQAPCGSVRLRPLSEADWALLLPWHQDSEVLYWAEGGDVLSRPMGDMQEIYRWVSRSAYCFVIELDGRAIGEGWLQEMNLRLLLDSRPSDDLRRIDLMIGDKSLWGHGAGTEVIRLLTHYAFTQTLADAVYGYVEDYNPRSARAFEKAGYALRGADELPPGGKGTLALRLCAERAMWP